MSVQEDAEAHCSAPYRAPELFDVPSQCVLDERVDVWSLGCLLYFIMYGISPFEQVRQLLTVPFLQTYCYVKFFECHTMQILKELA